MTIFVFGNPDVEMDSLPVRLIPSLQHIFPSHSFITIDPNEDWDVPHTMTIIDTVVGLAAPRVFEGLEHFLSAPRLSCHDFDAYANLKLLKKLGKIDDVLIFGLPPGYDADAAIAWLTTNISSLAQ